MKFDVVVGNPPYESDYITGDRNRKEQIYNYFYESAKRISDKYILISPARFLANQGGTPKRWNKEMLDDDHIKLVKYFANSRDVFPSQNIKGGVSIIYRDSNQFFGKLDTFIPFEPLRTAYKKVKTKNLGNISEIFFNNNSYTYKEVVFEDYPELIGVVKHKGDSYRLTSNTFARYAVLYHDEKLNDNKKYIQIYGRINGKRVFKYIEEKYVKGAENLNKWKVFVPGANGSGAIGEELSTPLIGEPLIGHNQTFVSIGSFETEQEAVALIKYIKTKFFRAMLGIMKITQNNQAAETWSKVPLFDFSRYDNIDWTKTIPEIDQELYQYFGLSDDEINFIEEKVKAMD